MGLAGAGLAGAIRLTRSDFSFNLLLLKVQRCVGIIIEIQNIFILLNSSAISVKIENIQVFKIYA